MRSQFRAEFKVVLLVAMVLVVTLAAVLWRTQSLVLEDKMSFVNDSAMKQLAPLKRLVLSSLENEKNDLIRFATARESQGPGHVSAFGVFDTIALVETSAQGAWAPAWIEKGSGLRQEKWPSGYDLTLLKSLPYARVKDGNSLWVRLSDAQGAPLFAVLDSVEIQVPMTSPQPAAGALPGAPVAAPAVAGSTRRAVIVGFASENPIAGVTDDYIGSTNSVYIVDDRGYVASHVKNNYLGNSFADDPMTKEIITSKKLTDTKQTVDIDHASVIGHFEKIDRTNLTAVILTPTLATTALASSHLHAVLTVGGAVGILSLLAAWFIGSTLTPVSAASPVRAGRAADLVGSEASENDDEADAFKQTSAGVTPPPLKTPPREVPRAELDESVSAQKRATEMQSELQNERRNAFEAFNVGLAARMREPLLAILGHAQLAKAKSSDESLTAHAESIEREARMAKEAIDRFQVIEESASDLRLMTEKSDLEKVVLSALAEKAIEIEGSGITLEQQITHVPRVLGRPADLESMVVHILENSIEALRDRPRKKMTIQLSMLKDRVRLLISDSGIGMTRDVRAKAFEPFFKGFEAPRHMGLGLAFVGTMMKRIGATYELESSPGEGTVFTIEFPVDASAKKEFESDTAPLDLNQINSNIDAFTLGGRKPIVPANVPPPPNARAEIFTTSAPVTPLYTSMTEARELARDMANVPKLPPTNPPSSPVFAIPNDPFEEDDEAHEESHDQFARGSEPNFTPLSAPLTTDATARSRMSSSESELKEFTISEITNAGIHVEERDGFRVKIRKPKPRG